MPGKWCKEYWKEIVIVIGAVLIITAIVITGVTSLVPLLTFWGLSVKLATVVSVTVCGIAFLASSIYLLGYPLNILGKIFKSDTLKTISFGLRHPIISLQIGKVKPGVGNTNISTNASCFANAFDINYNTYLDLNYGIIFLNNNNVTYEEFFKVSDYDFTNKISEFIIYPYRQNESTQVKYASFEKNEAEFKCIKKDSDNGYYYRLYPIN